MTKRAWLVAAVLLVIVAGAVTAGVLLTRTGNGDGASPTPTSTAAADVKAEVEQAYLAYWEARATALMELDIAPLEQVTTGEALVASRDLVEEQRAANQPVRVRVEHNYQIVIRSSTEAVVDDNLVSHSVRLNPETLEPIEPDPKLTIRNTYTLRKVEGRWRVAEIIGIESSP